MTDCKALYDAVYRETIQQATDKRVAIEGLVIRVSDLEGSQLQLAMGFVGTTGRRPDKGHSKAGVRREIQRPLHPAHRGRDLPGGQEEDDAHGILFPFKDQLWSFAQSPPEVAHLQRLRPLKGQSRLFSPLLLQCEVLPTLVYVRTCHLTSRSGGCSSYSQKGTPIRLIARDRLL